MKKSNPKPVYAQNGKDSSAYWVLPGDYPYSYSEYQEHSSGLTALAWMFGFIPPLCLLFLVLARRAGEKTLLERHHYSEFGPDTVRYGLYRQGVLVQPFVAIPAQPFRSVA